LPEATSGTTTYDKQPEVGGAKSGVNPNDPISLDPDLAQIVAAWPTLPECIPRAMLALAAAGMNEKT
jgi:hypothetical protein